MIRPKILIVDDKPANLMAMKTLLRKVDADVIEAGNGQDALTETLRHSFALALLDVQMPDMDGYELAEFMLSAPATAQTPIIFLTAAHTDEQNRFKAYKSGAVDYIVKPFDPDILLVKVQVFLELSRYRHNLEHLIEDRTKTIRHLYEMHRLAAQVSSDFLNLPIKADIDAEVEKTLDMCLPLLEADRGWLMVPDSVYSGLIVGYERTLDGIPSLKARNPRLHPTHSPEIWKSLQLGRIINIKADDRPDGVDPVRDAVLDSARNHFETGVMSVLALPLRVDMRIGGLIGFESFHRDRKWPESATKLLLLIGDTLISAINRQKTIRSVRESEHRFRSLFESLAVAVHGIDEDRRVIYWNPQSEKLYGYTAQEVLNRPVEEFIYPETDRPAVIKRLDAVISGEWTLAAGEEDRCHAGGTMVPVITSHTAFRNHAGNPEVFFLDVDLTAQKMAERDRERMELQYLQAQKMEAVGQLAGGVAHDFNNLLTVISGYAKMLLGDEKTSGGYRREILAIREAAQRAQDLTRQLLTFSRKQPFQRGRASLNTVIEKALSLYRRLLPENMDFEFKPGPDLPTIYADTQQIEQVVANLIVNARDAVLAHPDQSRKHMISIETVARNRSEFAAGLADSAAIARVRRYVCMIVRDTGIGMDEKTKPRIFEPFYTTKPAGSGTGLGLATVFGIIKRHEGHIDVESSPLEGTSFNLYWPEATDEDRPESGSNRDAVPLAGTESVLLVEGDPAIQDMVATGLGRLGYRVKVAADAKAAIKQAEATGRPIDIAIVDIVLPGMNGVQLHQKLETEFAGIQVILCSGHPDNTLESFGLDPSSSAILRKPYSIGELSNAIRKVFDRGESPHERKISVFIPRDRGGEVGPTSQSIPMKALPPKVVAALKTAAANGDLNSLSLIADRIRQAFPREAAEIAGFIQRIDYRGLLKFLE